MTSLLVMLGAGAGAVLRFLTGHFLDEERFPRGTLLVNGAGSFLIGLFSALSLGEQQWALAATGFCGGLTTWSSFVVQTRRTGGARGAAYAVGTLVLSLLGCTVAFALVAG